MKKVVIIPARFGSSRLPGKPLADIAGKPMIVRVCESVDPCLFDDVVVATDDARIESAVLEAGFKVVLTRPDHSSGTDRLQEAAEKLNLFEEDIIINLQGDEPLMPTENLSQVAQVLMDHPEATVATLYETETVKSLSNPNMVKLVQSQGANVLYFSRAPIPFDRDGTQSEEATFKRHVGIYAYRKSALDKFIQYGEGQLEALEKLEQLRFMEQGHTIVAEKAQQLIPAGVDTEEDLDNVRKIFKGDPS
jgi:3-deoxy-manno-octulosonate cytidylyltransferase (CMP-KDO synthetase)